MPSAETMWPRKEIRSLNREHFEGFTLRPTLLRQDKMVCSQYETWRILLHRLSSKGKYATVVPQHPVHQSTECGERH